MGEPALQLGPAAEAAGEAAARQTTRLIVIEGGKGTAAVEAGAARGILASVGTVAAGVAAFFTVLLWPSTAEAPGITDTQAGSDPKPSPLPVPQAIPQPSSEPIQKCPEKKQCPPHDWVVKNPGKSIEEDMADKQGRLDNLKKSPSRAGEMRGLQFEKDAAELNNRKRPVEAVGREYVCRRCGVEQEVDLVFKDGQIAEAKSASLKTVQKKKKQAERLNDLQVSLNCQKGTQFKPLAKLDDTHAEVDQVAKKLGERGFEIERLNTAGGG